AKIIDSTLFPGVQGGPLMHVIAAKAVCFHEALQAQFREYQRQVVLNAKALAAGLAKHGYRMVSGGTDNHLMLVDLRPKEINGKEAQEVLDRAGITVNENAIPFDTDPIFKPSGIRMATTRIFAAFAAAMPDSASSITRHASAARLSFSAARR